MSSALATLSIDLEMRLAKFEQSLDKSARMAEKNAERHRAAWARVGAGAAEAAGVVAGLFAGNVLVSALNRQVDALDSLNDAADATGASIENLSALEDVGKRVGTEFDTVTGILVKFNAVLADAEPGSAQEDALRSIGLSAAELRRVDPAEALRQAAVALSRYADDGEKARLVQDLFGKSVREAAPFLKDLAEQGELNAKYTAEQAAEAEKFNKQIFQLKTNVEGAARAITTTLVPALNNMFDRVREDGGFFAAIWKDIQVRYSASSAANANRDLAKAVTDLAKLESTPEGSRNLVQKARIKELREDIKTLQSEALAANVEVKRLLNGGRDPEPQGPNYFNDRRSSGEVPDPIKRFTTPKDKKSGRESIDEASLALARYVEQQQRELEQAVELTEQQKALNLLRELGATGQVPQVRELVLRLAEQTEELKRQEEIEKGIADYLAQQAAARKQIDDAIDGFSGRTGDALKRAQTERLEQRIAGGEAFTPEELNKIVKGIAGISDEVKDKLSEMDEFAKQAARNIQDSLGASIKNVLKGDFDSIGDLWANLLLDMAAQAAAARIGKELFGDFLSGGSLGGGIGDLFKLGASFFGIPGFASGGDHSGGVRLVGERGPELEFTGPSRIVDANRTQQLLRPDRGSGRTVLQLNYAPVSYIDSRADRAAIAADIEASHRVNNRELLALIKDRMRA